MSKILIVEDEDVIRSALRRLLERSGYEVSEAGSVQEALDNHKPSAYDLVITDLRLPGAQGTDIIEHTGNTPVLVMTSYASVKSAVDAMKLGAVDYISKPFDHEEMLNTVQRVLQDSAAGRPSTASAERTAQAESEAKGNGEMIGECEAMLQLFNRIRKVSPTDSTVLILGESGTGKELVARALHEQSHRANGELISVNCAAIPETLIESELFGHEKGAFTGANAQRKGLVEAADGGTLFLDEIGELPLEAQARLLRLLQEKEVRRVGSVQSKTVDVRLVAATHRNLKDLARSGQFREDLYYRLNVVELRLPPLRERGKDVEKLARELLKRMTQRMGETDMSFSTDAINAINQYRWPGNVRELENAIERAVILCEGPLITAELLNLDLHSEQAYELDDDIKLPKSRNAVPDPSPSNSDPSEDLSLEDYFQRFVLEHQGQMTETELAQKLGISRKCLWERRQRYGIPRKKTAAR